MIRGYQSPNTPQHCIPSIWQFVKFCLQSATGKARGWAGALPLEVPRHDSMNGFAPLVGKGASDPKNRHHPCILMAPKMFV